MHGCSSCRIVRCVSPRRWRTGTEVLSDGDNAKPMRIENSHRMRFIEMYLAGIDPDTGISSPNAAAPMPIGYPGGQGIPRSAGAGREHQHGSA